MQSRRYEDFTTQSPIAPRLRDRRLDLVPDPYSMRRSPQPRRSLSPRRVEGSNRVLGGNRRSSSMERRDYVWDLGANRAGRVRSRSPPLGLVQKRPHYDEVVTLRDLTPVEVYRRYETSDYMDMNADEGTGYKNDYAYKRSTTKVIREDFDGGRLDGAAHRMLGQKSMVLEDGTSGGVYRVPEDSGPTSKYAEYGGNFSSTSVNLGLGRFKDERVQYPDPLILDKYSAMETYEKGEKPMFHSRDAGYSTAAAASHPKDFTGTSHQFKDFTSTSSGNSRVNFPGSFRVGMPLPSDQQLRSSGKLQEPLTISGYGQRLETGHEAEQKDLAFYGRDTSSPTRAERQDYLYSRPEERESDDYGYPSDEIYRRVALSEQVDYEYDHKDMFRPNMVEPVTERVHNTEFSRRNPSSSSVWDHPYMEKQTVSNHIGMSRSSAASKQGGQYLDPVSAHLEFGRKVSKEPQIPHLGESRNHEISHLRLDYGFERDTGLVSRKERMRRSPEFQYETEINRLAVKTHGMKPEELVAYGQSDRMLKRKYAMDEEMDRHNSRSIMSSKWNNSSRTQDRNARGDEWIGQDASGSFLSKRLVYDHELNRRAERIFDRIDRHRGSASRHWMSSHDPAEHLQEHSNQSYKPVGRNIKGHSKLGSLSWHNSYHSDKRHVLPKPHNVWIRGKDDNQVDVPAIEVEKSEDRMSYAKSEPPEDSEEFKQLVQKYFLSFTKKLNDNPIVRKRYKEQGRAGSLFCIVCGRSLSKEFMDTQRLVTHAFMSHKIGLRAQHLGLQKAICVLLGWSNVVPTDVVTWCPETISSAEALAQKEDLILWPPVIVIHNSFLPDHDQQGRRNITIEALEDFLRGKGVSGGKVKVGKPGFNSTMVVKFLGTFSGLQDAEKLHGYFAENKRGRRDFEQIGFSKGKSREGKMEGDKVDELVLYGYMGIAEDLDKVDFDTKRKCSIKSKKEIQDLVDAPVKPE